MNLGAKLSTNVRNGARHVTVQIERRITSTHVQAIVDYWHLIRGGRPAPDTTDLDPIALPKASLPYVILADLELDPFRIRYRLVGSHQTEFFDDYRSRYIEDLCLPDGIDQILMADYKQATEAVQPVVCCYSWPKQYGHPALVNYAIMPLLRDGQVVRFLSVEHISDAVAVERLDREDLVYIRRR
jgi:hypothetical protein